MLASAQVQCLVLKVSSRRGYDLPGRARGVPSSHAESSELPRPDRLWRARPRRELRLLGHAGVVGVVGIIRRDRRTRTALAAGHQDRRRVPAIEGLQPARAASSVHADAYRGALLRVADEGLRRAGLLVFQQRPVRGKRSRHVHRVSDRRRDLLEVSSWLASARVAAVDRHSTRLATTTSRF